MKKTINYKNYLFEIMPMEWAKRRTEKNAKDFESSIVIKDFIKDENHKDCKINIKYESGKNVEFDGKISKNSSYKKEDGKLIEYNIRWTLQGIDCNGNYILLKLIN